MKTNENINNVDLLFKNIRKIRLLTDIITHLEEIKEKTPEFIDENEGFFKKNFKKIKNSFYSEFYKKAQKSLDEKITKYNQLVEEQINSCYRPNYLNEMIDKIINDSKTIANEIFSDDSYELGKIEFVMNVLCDNYAKFLNNEELNSKISYILNENEDFVDNVLNNLTEAYQKIGIKPTEGITAKLHAPLLTGLATLVIANPLVAMGLVGVSLAECITTLCGLKFSMLDQIKNGTTKTIDSIQKEILLKEFYNLNVDQTAFYLAKSTVLLLQINKFRGNDPIAEEIYESYVENYIDIKSDITLKMLLKDGLAENIEKAKVFNNVDIYLATKLQEE